MTPEQRAAVENLTGSSGLSEITGVHGSTTIIAKTIIAPGDTFAVYAIAADGSAFRHPDEPFISNPAWRTPAQLAAELATQYNAQTPVPCEDDTHPRHLMCMEFSGHGGTHRTYKHDSLSNSPVIDEEW